MSQIYIRKYNVITALMFMVSTFLSCSDSKNSSTDINPKPNLIVILTDDQGYSDVGCYGAKGFSTPNLDQMAERGIRFTDFYAAPTCSPARASLLTGTYANRIGINRPLNGPDIGLHPDEITIAEKLKEEGYATALVGKWHLGIPDEMSPVAQGFDYFSGIPLSHIRKGRTEHTHGPEAYYNRQWKTMGVGIETEVEYAPDETLFTQRSTAESLKFIKENHKQPFFLYLAHPQVHREVLSSEAFKGRSEVGRYGDSVEELDWSVGKILNLLKYLKIEKNTLVVFASDNGPWLNQGDESGSAIPLRGGKFSTWEGGVRVPCIMQWPGKIPTGTVSSEVAGMMDIFPTFMKHIGAKMPSDRVIDGKDIWPLITGQKDVKPPHNKFYYYNLGYLKGVRSGKWKLHRSDNNWALFDLENDISESIDVSKDNPEVLARLHKYLEEARIDMGDKYEKVNGMMMTEGENSRPLGRLSE